MLFVSLVAIVVVILVGFGKTCLNLVLVVAVLVDVGLPRRHFVRILLLRCLGSRCLLGEVGLLAHDHVVEDGAMVVQRRLLLIK